MVKRPSASCLGVSLENRALPFCGTPLEDRKDADVFFAMRKPDVLGLAVIAFCVTAQWAVAVSNWTNPAGCVLGRPLNLPSDTRVYPSDGLCRWSAARTITMAVLGPLESSAIRSAPVLSVLPFAVDTVNSDPALLPGYRLRVVYSTTSTACALGSVMSSALVFLDQFDVRAFVGPQCAAALRDVSVLGAHYNIPVMAWSHSSAQLHLEDSRSKVSASSLKQESLLSKLPSQRRLLTAPSRKILRTEAWQLLFNGFIWCCCFCCTFCSDVG